MSILDTRTLRGNSPPDGRDRLLETKIDSLTPTDTQYFESKLEKSDVFRMKGRQPSVILIKKQNTFIIGDK